MGKQYKRGQNNKKGGGKGSKHKTQAIPKEIKEAEKRKCEFCSHIFKNQDSLTTHLASKVCINPCDMCGKNFVTLKFRQDHLDDCIKEFALKTATKEAEKKTEIETEICKESDPNAATNPTIDSAANESTNANPAIDASASARVSAIAGTSISESVNASVSTSTSASIGASANADENVKDINNALEEKIVRDATEKARRIAGKHMKQDVEYVDRPNIKEAIERMKAANAANAVPKDPNDTQNADADGGEGEEEECKVEYVDEYNDFYYDKDYIENILTKNRSLKNKAENTIIGKLAREPRHLLTTSYIYNFIKNGVLMNMMRNTHTKLGMKHANIRKLSNQVNKIYADTDLHGNPTKKSNKKYKELMDELYKARNKVGCFIDECKDKKGRWNGISDNNYLDRLEKVHFDKDEKINLHMMLEYLSSICTDRNPLEKDLDFIVQMHFSELDNINEYPIKVIDDKRMKLKFKRPNNKWFIDNGGHILAKILSTNIIKTLLIATLVLIQIIRLLYTTNKDEILEFFGVHKMYDHIYQLRDKKFQLKLIQRLVVYLSNLTAENQKDKEDKKTDTTVKCTITSSNMNVNDLMPLLSKKSNININNKTTSKNSKHNNDDNDDNDNNDNNDNDNQENNINKHKSDDLTNDSADGADDADDSANDNNDADNDDSANNSNDDANSTNDSTNDNANDNIKKMVDMMKYINQSDEASISSNYC